MRLEWNAIPEDRIEEVLSNILNLMQSVSTNLSGDPAPSKAITDDNSRYYTAYLLGAEGRGWSYDQLLQRLKDRITHTRPVLNAQATEFLASASGLTPEQFTTAILWVDDDH